ncbi:MAG: hypothetical protein ACXWB9_00495 [Flavisolibacter sp.]
MQDHFSKCFPQLRLAFFARAHKKGTIPIEEDKITPDQLIGDIRKKGLSGQMQVLSSVKASELENQLEKEFGLYGQVLRNENDNWLQTIDGNLSLRQLCDMGVVSRES